MVELKPDARGETQERKRGVLVSRLIDYASFQLQISKVSKKKKGRRGHVRDHVGWPKGGTGTSYLAARTRRRKSCRAQGALFSRFTKGLRKGDSGAADVDFPSGRRQGQSTKNHTMEEIKEETTRMERKTDERRENDLKYSNTCGNEKKKIRKSKRELFLGMNRPCLQRHWEMEEKNENSRLDSYGFLEKKEVRKGGNILGDRQGWCQ